MEFPDVGAQCDAQDCRQLDFLPFVCIGCGKIFCLHHRGQEDHSCSSKAGQLNHSTNDEQSKELQGFQSCSREACEQTVLSLISCSQCGKGFCINHRHPEDHSCPIVQTQVQRKITIKQQPISSAQPRGRVGRKSSETALRVKIMKMKMKAEGNQSVPQDHRIYFNVKCKDFKTGTESPVFFNKHSTIGFVVDDLARMMKLINPNNRTAGKRLCLLDAAGRHLPSHAKIEDLTGSEGSLYEGQTLSLQYITQ